MIFAWIRVLESFPRAPKSMKSSWHYHIKPFHSRPTGPLLSGSTSSESNRITGAVVERKRKKKKKKRERERERERERDWNHEVDLA